MKHGFVIWSDDDLLAINKPPMVLCIPGGYNDETEDLVSILESDFGRVWVVHRLDRETSGVVIYARSANAHKMLNQSFADRIVRKTYHALVEGEPEWEKKIVELPLKVNGDRSHRTVVNHRDGKQAHTQFSVIERYRHYTLLEANPMTGRRHQIRAHLAAVGHPIVADSLYGSQKYVYLSVIKPGYRKREGAEQPLLSRLGLHASALIVPHPGSGETMNFEAPYPGDFQATINQCRKYAPNASSK